MRIELNLKWIKFKYIELNFNAIKFQFKRNGVQIGVQGVEYGVGKIKLLKINKLEKTLFYASLFEWAK